MFVHSENFRIEAGHVAPLCTSLSRERELRGMCSGVGFRKSKTFNSSFRARNPERSSDSGHIIIPRDKRSMAKFPFFRVWASKNKRDAGHKCLRTLTDASEFRGNADRIPRDPSHIIVPPSAIRIQ